MGNQTIFFIGRVTVSLSLYKLEVFIVRFEFLSLFRAGFIKNMPKYFDLINKLELFSAKHFFSFSMIFRKKKRQFSKNINKPALTFLTFHLLIREG